MHVLIIEDEPAAARRLAKMLEICLPEATVIGELDTIDEAVAWFQENDMPDLAFFDIHLADGASFEIFKEVSVTCPIIFTTAYDQYALEAFKVNSIDYILKPLKQADLAQAIAKFQRLYQGQTPTEEAPPDYNALLEALPAQPQQFQKRIVIKYGQHIKALEIADAAYFYIEAKVTLLCTFAGKTYPVDQNLDQLEAILDPAVFFRINRKFIINVGAIKQMYAYSKSRVKLSLAPAVDQETIVSSERSSRFKQWLKG